MKIRIIDDDKESPFETFNLSGETSIDIEKRLLAWFLECSDFESTVEMIEDKMGVTIEVIEPEEDEE